MAWCVWVTGLPGSGKSTIVNELMTLISDRDIFCELLRLDDIRKELVPNPEYTDEERERVYGALAAMARERVAEDANVVVDATANRRQWRDSVRRSVEDYLEVLVDCPLEECMAREASRPEGRVMADIYRKALERRDRGIEHEGLGQVVGVDVEYERSPDTLVLDAVALGPRENAELLISELNGRGWL